MDNAILLTETVSLRWILAVAICSTLGYASASEVATHVVKPKHSERCVEAISQAPFTEADQGLILPFTVLNWNVEKAQHPGLVAEFAAYAERSDLIFLQEAVPLKKNQTVVEQSLYEAFVRGYVQNQIETGVLTLARVPHLVHWSERRLRAVEQLAAELQLTPVPFSPDHRTTTFGNPLDHLYVRGLTWRSTEARPVSTSDHNPLFATLEQTDP